MENKNATLKPDSFYHSYNRANGSELVFVRDDKYPFFLDKLKWYNS